MAKARNINTLTKQSMATMGDKTFREYMWALVSETRQLSEEVDSVKRLVGEQSVPSEMPVLDDDEARPEVRLRRQRDGRRKRTVWFVDTENVGREWVPALSRYVRQGDVIRYMYTSNSPSVPKGLAAMCRNLGVTLDYDACDCGRPNALDFQIVCAMSMCAVRQGSAYRYRVVSSDRGFTMATGYLVKQGYDAAVVSLDVDAS